MNQKLIDALWRHTDNIDSENATKMKWPTNSLDMSNRLQLSQVNPVAMDIEINSVSSEEREQFNLTPPKLLPASLFFSNTSISLFMSFHHETANSNKHCHDFFELIYVCKGAPIGVINDQAIQMQEGNLYIMNPNAVHYFKKYSEETDLILNIVLPKDLFQKSIFQILFNDPILNAFFIRYRIENDNQPSYLYLPHLDKDIDNLIELLLKEYLAKMQYSHVMIESLLTLIFSLILRNYKENSNHNNSAIAEIIDYIYMNYHTVSMSSVALRFNYHPKYLSSLIHKNTGQTFRDLVVNIKLQNFLNYLLYTDYTIEQIVDLIGYKDKSSLYSQFKKVYGMSPAAYRTQFSYRN